jgi:Flp pilus assembly protein TadB
MSDYPSFPVWFELLVSLFMIALSFFILSLSFYVSKKIRTHFEEQFPQFVKA